MDNPPDISEMQQNILEIKSILSKTYLEFSQSAYAFLLVGICFLSGYILLVALTLTYPIIFANGIYASFDVPLIQTCVRVACPLISVMLFKYYKKKRMNIANVAAKHLVIIWSMTLVLFFVCELMIFFRNIFIQRVSVTGIEMYMQFLDSASVMLFITFTIIVIALVTTGIITDSRRFFTLAWLLGIAMAFSCIFLPIALSGDTMPPMPHILYAALQHNFPYCLMGLASLSVFFTLKKTLRKEVAKAK